MQVIFVSGRFGRFDLSERVRGWRFGTRAGVGFLDAEFTVVGAERDLYALVEATGTDMVEFWAYGERVWWGNFTGTRLVGRGTQTQALQVRAAGAGMRLLDTEVWRVFSDVEFGRWEPEADLAGSFAADNNNRVYVAARGDLSSGDRGRVTYPEPGVLLGAGLVRVRANVLVEIAAGAFAARLEDDAGNVVWSTAVDVDTALDVTLDDVAGLVWVLECTADGEGEAFARLTAVQVQTLDPCTPSAIATAVAMAAGLPGAPAPDAALLETVFGVDITASLLDVDAAVYQGETSLRVLQDAAYWGDGAESWLLAVYDKARLGPWPAAGTLAAERRHLPEWEIEYRRADVCNAVRVMLPDGWVSAWVEDAESIAQWGRREQTLDLPRMARALAAQYAALYLAEHAWPIAAVHMAIGGQVWRSDSSPWPAVMIRAGDVVRLADLTPGEPREIRVAETETTESGIRLTPQGGLNRVEYLLAMQKRAVETPEVRSSVAPGARRGVVGLVAHKSHRVADVVFANTNWTDIEWDLRIDTESTAGITYYDEGGPGEDTSILVIAGVEDVLNVMGCVRPLWTGAPGANVIVATRVVFSYDDGTTWTEARCLQSVVERARQADEVGTQHYLGTIKARNETWIKLQVQVANTGMQLAGWGGFTNPVAASIELNALGARATLA